jgi:DHA1 family multidrug resistance protein-like MFS transporter
MQLFLCMPKLVQDVMRDQTSVGIVLSSVSIFIILLQMKVVEWLDGFHQRLTLIGLGTLVMGVGLFLLSFANSLPLLIIDAFLFALGTMISAPLLVDMVPRFAPKELLGAYYGFNGYSLAIGGSIGQVAGGWVYDMGVSLTMPWLPWVICLIFGIAVAMSMYWMEQKLQLRLSGQEI